MNILYIDDKKADILYIKKILQEKCRLLGFSCPKKALHFLKETNIPIDILLIDYKLTNIDGISVYKSISIDLNMNIPAILITGVGDEELVLKAISEGINDYINKERINKKYLLDKICSAIEKFNTTERKEKEICLLKNRAYYDQLTQLPNRLLLFDRIKQEIKKYRREKNSFGLMFVDIDGFKNINDSFGHEIGDELLIEISRRIENIIRITDTVSRLGGDEFVILLPDMSDKALLAKLANMIIEVISDINSISSSPINISASIGISIFDEEDSVNSIINRADKAMYEVKKKGKSGYSFSCSSSDL